MDVRWWLDLSFRYNKAAPLCTYGGSQRGGSLQHKYERDTARGGPSKLSLMFAHTSAALSVLDALLCLLVLVLSKWAYTRRSRAPKSLPHPPGPPGLPIIGNLFDMPANPAWSKYEKFSKDYGPSVVG